MTLGSSLMISADQRNAKNIEYKISLSHCLQNVATIFTYPWAESNKFEDCLESKTHGKGEVHIREEVRQHQRGSIKLWSNIQMKKENYCAIEYFKTKLSMLI